MSDRRVSVTVAADYQPLIDGSGKAAVSVKAVQEEMKGLDKQVEETERDMGKLAAAAAVAKKEVGDLGDKSSSAKRDLEQLDARIEASRKATQQLGLEFARTGDKIDGAAFGREKSLLARLERLRKELTSAGDSNGNGRGLLADAAGVASMVTDAAAAGEKVGGSFVSGITDAFKELPVKGILIASLVGGIIAALPAVGAAVAGAVTGVVGVGGIAGGIFAASKDPVVRSAAQQFGTYLSQQFFSGGSVFVDPIRQALAILKADVDKLDLGHLFGPAAADVTLLATGLGNFVNRAAPGFQQALKNSGPFLSAMADGLGEVGDAFGQFMDDVSRNHGAIEGLRWLFGAVDVTIRILGKSLEFLAGALHIADVVFLKLVDTAAAVAKALHLPHDDLDQLHKMLEANINSGTQLIPVVDGLGDSSAGTARDINTMVEALADAQKHIDDYITSALAMGDANTAVAQDFADLNDKIKAGKKNWDDNTQAGRDNRNEVRRIIEDLERQRQQAIATSDGSQASIDAINRKYNEMEDQLEKNLIKLGATKDAIEAIAGKAWHITIITDILNTAAVAKATKNDKNLAIHGFAAGGTTPAYAPFVVGEHGPEVLWDTKQHYVETKAMAQQPAVAWNGGGSSGGQIVVQNTVLLLDPMTGKTIRGALRNEATSRGKSSDVVSAAYP